MQDLARRMSDVHQIDGILMDFAKAFDKVPLSALALQTTPLWDPWLHSLLDRELLHLPKTTSPYGGSHFI
jgi:hypothetical protein